MMGQWQIVHAQTGRLIGAPGDAYAINQECTRLNDAVNPEGRLRVTVYRIERANSCS
jgi:hypothetical protein